MDLGSIGQVYDGRECKHDGLLLPGPTAIELRNETSKRERRSPSLLNGERAGVRGRTIDKVGDGARHLCRFSVRSSCDLHFIRAAPIFEHRSGINAALRRAPPATLSIDMGT